MGEAEDRRGQELLLARLQEMGVAAALAPGGRALVGTLALRPVAFEGPAGPRYYERLRFASVGSHHIKCLEPHCFFQLPLLSVAGCSSARTIEERVRDAWATHCTELKQAAGFLEGLGIPAQLESGGAVLSFGVGLEDPAVRARFVGRRVALPGRGPLAGLVLSRARDRLFLPQGEFETAVDLEFEITNRLEALARAGRRAAERRRSETGLSATPRKTSRRLAPAARRILLVGSHLWDDPALCDGLRALGYRVVGARSAGEALNAFAASSYDAVITEADLGRLGGVELIPALRALPGVAALPVVVVDGHTRETQRQAARAVGAAGYLVHPIDPRRIAPGLARIAEGRGMRRFDRFERRLAVGFQGSGDAGFTTALSRMGAFVRTPRESSQGALERIELRLPDYGRTLRIEAQTAYCVEAAGARDPGLGLRFISFPEGDERLLVETVRSLEDECEWR